MSSNPITGRYAPSPTGRLHLGNLRTAWRARSVPRHVSFA
ncbi:glutamate--tRNA ligase family protein [Corynebacterium amycolatum]|nr:glutamate--tRNA ligase family protein [Corynebacterium amycolatum]